MTLSRSGPLQLFKLQAVKKVIECAIDRQDDYAREKMQATIDPQGDQVSVQLKNCYCSYTLKYHIKKLESRMRKAASIDINEAPPARIGRSLVRDFD